MASLNDLKYLSILYADDDEALRYSTSNILKTLCNNIYVAKNGEEAISIYENTKDIQIIMLDIKMGSVSGIDVAQYIRNKNKDVQIFLVSSYSETEDLINAIKLRVVNYIQKPFSFKELTDTLINCLDNMYENNQFMNYLNEEIKYNPYKKELILKDTIIALSNNEVTVLEYLIKHKGQLISYESLMYVLGFDTTEIALQNVISRLHKKMGKRIIKNIPKIGYILE